MIVVGTRRTPTIVDETGTVARLSEFIAGKTGEELVIAELQDGTRVRLPSELLHPHDDGGYAIYGRWDRFVAIASDHTSIPVLEEHVTVDVKTTPRERVRVRRSVVKDERVIETPLWQERVHVDRMPVDAFVDRYPEPRQEGDTLIIPCVEEVLVVEKRLRVREEIRLRVVREPHTHQQSIVLRRHEVDIQRETDLGRSETKQSKEEGEHS